MMAGLSPKLLLLPGLLMALSAASPPAPITIDYPPEGSIFPPEITPPTWLWRDAGKSVAFWRIDVSFGDGGPEIHATSRARGCASAGSIRIAWPDTNQPPGLTPALAAAHSWTPDRATWQAIKRRSVQSDRHGDHHRLSRRRTRICRFPREASPFARSRDPVGAPIFYRDVPLMPSELEKGVIKPLAAEAVPLVAWRVRNVGEAAQPAW